MISQLMKIAPVYFIQGNHDCMDIDYNFLRKELEKNGVNILDNNFVDIGHNIRLIGLKNDFNDEKEYLKLNPIDESFYNICLIHKPSNFEKLKNNKFDLFLSGHTHGCQWRLPFIGGVISPDKKFFPGKDYGYKEINNTKGIINRGIGNQVLVPRLNNFPEIVILDISSLDK